jgi:hypothetical protein
MDFISVRRIEITGNTCSFGQVIKSLLPDKRGKFKLNYRRYISNAADKASLNKQQCSFLNNPLGGH